VLFDGMELRTLIEDLRSVKMNGADRARACALQSRPRWAVGDVGEAWALVRRFRRQLEELHSARERARQSRGRARMGLTRAQVVEVAAERAAEQRAQRDDLGI